MQPFHCDLQPQLQETQRTTPTGTTTRCKTHRRNQSCPEQPQPHPPHTGGTFHRRMQPLYTEKYKVSCSGFLPKTWPLQHSYSHSNAICNHSFKKRKELRPQEQPLVAKHIEGTNRVRNNRSHTRRTHEVPFIAACSHFTRKNTRFRAPASSPKQSPRNIHAAIPVRSATTDSKTPYNYNYAHTSTAKAAWSHRYNAAKNASRTQPHPPHTGGIAACSHFTRKKTRFRAPASSPTQSPMHHSNAICNLTTSLLHHHFPSSPLPFVTTSLHHHFPSSPLPFVTTFHRHRFPSSPLPFVTTSLCHHFPSSPLPFIAFYSFVMYCDTEPPFIALFLRDVYLWCIVTTSPPFINVKSHSSICP